MAYIKHPWQKSFRAIPKHIRAKIDAIDSPLITVATNKKIAKQDLSEGVYAHLDIRLNTDGTVAFRRSVLPIPQAGKYSTYNIHGREIVRRDLPKVTKTFSWETPNFGDGSTYGYHTHSHDREVYQRTYFEPRFLELSVDLISESDRSAAMTFQVGHTIDVGSADYEGDLLFCLNLLQENVGAVDVYPSDVSRDDYLQTIGLDWEIFPPGERGALIAAIRSQTRSNTDSDVAESRIELFSQLNPEHFLKGTGRYTSYVGAKFFDDLVVFENITYGNALYVLYENWEVLSQRSRLELLAGTSEQYDRFVHTDGWQDRFMDHIRREINLRES